MTGHADRADRPGVQRRTVARDRVIRGLRAAGRDGERAGRRGTEVVDRERPDGCGVADVRHAAERSR